MKLLLRGGMIFVAAGATVRIEIAVTCLTIMCSLSFNATVRFVSKSWSVFVFVSDNKGSGLRSAGG